MYIVLMPEQNHTSIHINLHTHTHICTQMHSQRHTHTHTNTQAQINAQYIRAKNKKTQCRFGEITRRKKQFIVIVSFHLNMNNLINEEIKLHIFILRETFSLIRLS